VCWIYSADQKIDGASVPHRALVAAHTMKLAAPHAKTARLYNLVDEFRSQDFGLKLN
jgi:hypothetical protein